MLRAHRHAPLVLAMLCATAPLSAQDPAEELVPLELVRTLAAFPYGRGGEPEVLVGRLPDAVAELVAEAGAGRIVGGLIHSEGAIGVVAVPGSPGEVRDAWTARAEAAGWTPLRRHAELGGFASTPLGRAPYFCRDDGMLTLSVSRGRGGESYVHLVHRARGRTQCDAEEEVPFGRPRESLIPTLEPPADALTRRGGSGGGTDEWSSHARIRTRLTLDEVIDHYAGQLEGHGWTLLERATAPGIAARTFRVLDAEGAPWHGTLVGTDAEGAAERFLSVRVDRVERSR